jgi:microcystin-dependent protein
MSSPYVGEIRMFGGNFAPAGWEFCNGQLLPISEYDVLFNLIGTTYGGDGQNTFALPNLQGRVPVHMGNNGVSTYSIGESFGVESVTLTTNQLPIHSHSLLASTDTANSTSPTGNVPGATTVISLYKETGTPTGSMDPATISSTGGSQPHENMQPYLCVSFIISLFGIFPTQS